MSFADVGNALVSMWIYQSSDCENWTLVEPNKVPEWIRRDPEVTAKLVNGEGAQAQGSSVWFIGIIDKGQVKSSIIQLAGTGNARASTQKGH